MVVNQKPPVFVSESRRNQLVKRAAEKFRSGTYFRDLRWFTPEQDIIINNNTLLQNWDNLPINDGNSLIRGRIRRNFIGSLKSK